MKVFVVMVTNWVGSGHPMAMEAQSHVAKVFMERDAAEIFVRDAYPKSQWREAEIEEIEVTGA